MFGFGKKKVSAKDAMIAYIDHTAGVADDTFKNWLQYLMQSAADFNDVPLAKLAEAFGTKNVKLIYFAGLIALDAVAIENCFDGRTASALNGKLKECLQARMGEDGDAVAEAALHFLRRAKLQLEDMSALPHHAITFGMMELLGLDEHDETKRLFQDPLFVASVSEPLMLVGCGWWKAFSEKMRISV